MNKLKGSCHCGNVQFTLLTGQNEETLAARRCGCTMCRRHGASWISDPAGALEIQCRDVGQLSVYQFGHATSRWIVCARCGVLTAAICNIDGRLRAVVRSQAMIEHTFSAPEIKTDFDEESVEHRLARRARTWIGSVRMTPALDLQFAS